MDNALKTAYENLLLEIEQEAGMIEIHAQLKRGSISIYRLIVPRGHRCHGKGTGAMQRLIDFADIHQVRLQLSPAKPEDGLGTTSRDRLVRFYKRFGFVENKGSNRDPTVLAQMLRRPKFPNPHSIEAPSCLALEAASA